MAEEIFLPLKPSSLSSEDVATVDRPSRDSNIRISIPTLPSFCKRITITTNQVKDEDNKSGYIVPFNDSCNTTVNICKSYGPKKLIGRVGYDSKLIQFLSEQKYEDISSVEDVDYSLLSKRLLQDDNTVYPFILKQNLLNVEKQGAKIDVFNIYVSITRDLVMNQNIKGIKGNMGSTGYDIRGRNISVTSKKHKNNKTIEPYSDEGELTELTDVFKQHEYYLGNAIKSVLSSDKKSVTKEFDTSKKVLTLPKSRESRYFSDDDNKIEPFVERELGIFSKNYLADAENRFLLNDSDLLQFFNDKKQSNLAELRLIENESSNISEDNYASCGFKDDYNINCGSESIAFRGLIE